MKSLLDFGLLGYLRLQLMIELLAQLLLLEALQAGPPVRHSG